MVKITVICLIALFGVAYGSPFTKYWRLIPYSDSGVVESWPPNVSNEIEPPEATCSPWLGYCRQYEDCCRHLQCLFYAAKCVPKSGLIIPGQDTRPIGPGPYPPRLP